jgi:hypothetical protein
MLCRAGPIRSFTITNAFDFSYFTSILKTGERSYYYFCYEMGYLMINRETVLLVKRENHQRMEALR